MSVYNVLLGVIAVVPGLYSSVRLLRAPAAERKKSAVFGMFLLSLLAIAAAALLIRLDLTN